MPGPLFVLIHSPLVGPATWLPVALELKSKGVEVAVPELKDEGRSPSVDAHVESVVSALGSIERDRSLVFVAHSGAGPLLPPIAEALDRPVRAYLFFDAAFPARDMSRLHAIWTEDPEFGEELARLLSDGGSFPDWTFEDLEDDVPDPEARRAIVEDLRPRGMDYFTEPLPVFPGWPDAPIAYVLLTEPYLVSATRAAEAGARVEAMGGKHFHMLVAPEAVADAIVRLAEAV